MLLHASAPLHSVAFDFAMNNLRLFSLALVATAPPTAATPLFSLLSLFSLWQSEMGHSAAAAFRHADIPLYKQCLIALSVRVCVQVCVHACAHSCVFSPWCFIVWNKLTSRVLLRLLSGI